MLFLPEQLEEMNKPALLIKFRFGFQKDDFEYIVEVDPFTGKGIVSTSLPGKTCPPVVFALLGFKSSRETKTTKEEILRGLLFNSDSCPAPSEGIFQGIRGIALLKQGTAVWSSDLESED